MAQGCTVLAHRSLLLRSTRLVCRRTLQLWSSAVRHDGLLAKLNG